MIHELNSASDVWLEFPADLQKPLDAEYFYSQTPFTVTMEQTENGKQEVTSIRQDVKQQRIIGKIDFKFDYNNPYVRNAVIEKKVSLGSAHFILHFLVMETWLVKVMVLCVIWFCLIQLPIISCH